VGVGVLWGTLITHELRATFAAMIVVKVLLQRAERGVQSYVGAWLAAGTADPGTTLAAAPRETPSSTLPIAVPAAALLCSRDTQVRLCVWRVMPYVAFGSGLSAGHAEATRVGRDAASPWPTATCTCGVRSACGRSGCESTSSFTVGK